MQAGTADPRAVDAAGWALDHPTRRAELIRGYRAREIPTEDRMGFATRDFTEANAWIVAEHDAELAAA